MFKLYKFIDTIENKKGTVSLCSEAVSLDGEFIENHVQGYKTLTVSGRESLAYEITEEDRPVGTDGMNYYGKRQQGRSLVVQFSLTAPTPAEFMSRYRQLKNFCKGENRLIRFADEPNAHYTGTLSEIETPDPGKLSVIATMTFYCADPYLESDIITTVQAVEKDGKLVASVDNDSSGMVFPTYRIKHKTENGYIGIVHKSGAFEMGNIDEADKTPYKQSETLLNTDKDGYGLFEPYTGTHPQNSKISCNGTLKVQQNWQTGGNYQTFWIDNPGMEVPGMDAYGGCRRITLPADSEGEVGAQNFYIWFQQQFISGLLGQTGHNQVTLADENNKLIAAFATSKVDKTGATAYGRFYIGDGEGNSSVFKTFYFDTSDTENNPFRSRGYEDIKKEGSKITFFFWGAYYSIDVPALKNKKVKYVYVFIGNHNNSSKRVTVQTSGKILMIKNNVEKQRNVPNRYSAGSEVVINCEKDSITLRGLPANDEMVTGSAFYPLQSGQTDIEFYFSDWIAEKPEVTVEFRKRWL